MRLLHAVSLHPWPRPPAAAHSDDQAVLVHGAPQTRQDLHGSRAGLSSIQDGA
jgi:hypothetical protein